MLMDDREPGGGGPGPEPAPADTTRHGWLYDKNQQPTQDPGPGNYWAWDDGQGQWVVRQSLRAPTPTATPTATPTDSGTTGTTTYGSGGGPQAFGGGAFDWPSYHAPNFDDPGIFDAGPAFSYKDFVAPTGADVLKDPSFQFRLDQGQKALEASAAGKGILRSGGTMKDLLGYGQNFASQEYGNVYNRAANDYGMNRSNAADIWGKQYGQRQDVYGSKVNRSNSLNSFNVNNAQFDFTGRQQQAQSEFQDAFNRYRAQGDWLTALD